LAYSYMKNREDAMDVVQESVYKAIRFSERLKELEQISSWVYQIVVRTALDTIRKQKREIIGMEEYQEEGREDQYEDVDLIKSLSVLSEEERGIIVLRYFEEHKLKEIATILAEPENTIKSKLYRALKKLKIELGTKDGEMA
ncbi:MAG: sigma-70 family RNA polymerase sigma factor, partial [Firmicutes bacterium]|nr:sigma-70 family RNA polymerase sigma factor [Candidatus Scybalomonas excrementavium]